MKKDKILYLSKADVVETGLTMTQIIETLEFALIEKGKGRTEMPPKTNIYPGKADNFINAMPAYVPNLQSAGVKCISVFPGNPNRGLPYISGLIILNDPETLQPVSMMDCTWITAMRTAAATALSARFLARPESSTLGILGCGIQGRSHVDALSQLFDLIRIKAYDINLDILERYKKDIQRKHSIEVIAVETPYEAVQNSDIVVTAGRITKKPHATIQAGWLAKGSFVSMVDYDSYWHPKALQESDKFCTDDTNQMRYYQKIGYFQNIPKIHADLGELCAGKKPGRVSDNERNMAANLGMAIEDMALAKLVFEKANAKKIGTWLNL